MIKFHFHQSLILSCIFLIRLILNLFFNRFQSNINNQDSIVNGIAFGKLF